MVASTQWVLNKLKIYLRQRDDPQATEENPIGNRTHSAQSNGPFILSALDETVPGPYWHLMNTPFTE